MAVAVGVRVHTHGRVNHAPTAAVDGDVFSFKGGSTGCVMIMEPMTPLLNYYEYKILNRGAESAIGIGIGERAYPLNRMPGWNRNSIGYHGDDGKLYHENGAGSAFGPTCTQEDRMGCGVDFDSDVGYGYCEVFFTKNGEPVGHPVKMKRPLYGLYPIIGLHSRGEKVRYLGHWHRQRHTLLEPMVQDHSPSNIWLRSNNIKFCDDGLCLEYCGIGGGSQDVGLAQGKYPLNRTNYYFELQILDTGSLGAIAIGVGKSSYPLHRHPGWNTGAVGYHADDGQLFVERGKGEVFGPICVAGDRMGCGISFGDDSEDEEEKSKKEDAGSDSDDDSDSIYSLDDDSSLSDNEDMRHDDFMFYQQLLDRERMLGLGRGGGGRIQQHLFPGNIRGGGLFGRLGQDRLRAGRLNGPNVVVSGSRGESVKGNSGSKCTVYFTRNGERIGDTDVCIPKGGFFPLVGLLSKGEKVLEVAKAIFHTILFHRTTGKYSYNSHHSGTFSVGSVGLEDVDCIGGGFTYVRCASPELEQWITQQIEGFSSSLCQQSPDRCRSGRLTLEFYEKKTRWLLPPEITNWEVWHLQLFIFDPASEEEWQKHQQQLAEQMREKVMYIADVVNKPDYVPRNPSAENLSNVFDTKFPTVQPYLHRVNFELGGEGVAGTVRKFLRDTFTY